MSAFEKRVALVEKWHTDLTKSLDDMYDLAEQVLDVWQEAEAHTEERIIKLLEAEREKHIPWCGQVQPCPECLKTIGIENGIALIKGENK